MKNRLRPRRQLVASKKSDLPACLIKRACCRSSYFSAVFPVYDVALRLPKKKKIKKYSMLMMEEKKVPEKTNFWAKNKTDWVAEEEYHQT